MDHLLCMIFTALVGAIVCLRLERAVRGAFRRVLDQLCLEEAALEGRVERLEQGLAPEHEQARRAADALNDFNRGLANIMAYDPVRSRQVKRDGREDGR